jgi:PIN domain nuclease of toxin-antitoxin system
MIFAAYELPEPFHKVPADRLIVVIARGARREHRSAHRRLQAAPRPPKQEKWYDGSRAPRIKAN